MASESPIAKLAAKSPKYQAGVFAGIAVVLGLVYYQFFYSPVKEELSGAKRNYSRAETEQDKLNDRLREWEVMVNEKAALDEKLSTNQVSLPATAALPSFIGHLQRQAAVAGVTFRNWRRLSEEPGAGFVKVPIAVQVQGSFHQILKYLHLLGETKRIITVENFALGPDAKDDETSNLLTANFRATTFRQPDGAISKVAAPAAQQPPGTPEQGGSGNPVENITDRVDEANQKHQEKTEAEIDKASGMDRLKSAGGEQ